MGLGNVWVLYEVCVSDFPVHVIVEMLSPTLLNDMFGLCYELLVCY